MNEKCRAVAEITFDLPHPFLAPGENRLDGPEILVGKHQSERDLPVHPHTTRRLEGEAGGL